MAWRSRQRGFSLIEVLIASAIMILSMGLILQLFGSGLDRMHRVGRHAKQTLYEKEIYARLSTVNPAVEKSGEGKLGDWSFNWTVDQVEEFKPVSDVFGDPPYARDIALYRVDVAVDRPDREEDYRLELFRLGWRGGP